MSIIKNRSELVFLYDIKDANGNGDPLDSNKPRIDQEKGINLVTDVRLKRTIRDYLFDYKGFNGENNKDIFVREIEVKPGEIQDAKLRAIDFLKSNDEDNQSQNIIKEFLNNNNVEKENVEVIKENIAKNLIKYAIDVRLFGGFVPFEIKSRNIKGSRSDFTSSITYTGPIQFQMGRSLHKVEIKHIRGTGAFASGSGKGKKTFREEYILPYSLIGFYGIINENAAKDTNLTDDDIDLFVESIWKGTKNLITRSKIGQIPRLFLKVNYSEPNYFIGELKTYIKLQTDLEEEEIRDVSDYKLDISELLEVIKSNEEKIENVEYKVNPRLKLISNGDKINLDKLNLFEELDI